ncbi:probable palmitoyltransferase ZDHHC24 [Belonocnema kinseyi]|uniref:probable palmitoyltransferase ZDHHC24 n=1 Tax=Belonocnema kinseyi TaxID=2817044 RepID=UPI00143CD991|nr:probable palmitoyltransferase ZDHHC24 [Belonocnema kinseyi]
MIVRKNILPRTASDILSVGFILTAIPLLYWFELWVVLPDLYEFGSLSYFFHFFLGNFIILNIVGNFTYTVLCDTSTRDIIVRSSEAETKNGWRLCSSCESLAPPRSWHCNTCNTCILKRDHHCIFTGCCVGHKNHRHFLMFLFYLFVGTAYAFFFNNFFIWGRIHFEFPMSILKIVFPLAIFVFGFDGSIEQFYLLLYIVTVIGMLFTGALCAYHFHLVYIGCVANEKEKNKFIYDLGWKQNIVEVFGDRWYVAWLLPYINSSLPHDGIAWDTPGSWQENSNKTK